MSSLLKTLVLVCALGVAACGFSPMYGQYTDKNAVAGLDNVDIAMIPNEEGMFLRNDLIDRFYRSGYPSSPAYNLVVSQIVEAKRDLDITIESEATRKQIKLDTSFNLVDLATGKSVLSRKLTAITSYNVSATHFATRVSEIDAREAALHDLARQIEVQVALYFKK